MTAVEVTRVELVAPGPDDTGRRLRTAQAGFLAGYGPGTRKSYADGLRQWFRWCQHNRLDPLTVDRAHIDLWGRWLEENRQRTPATVLHRLCTLRSFYRYCEEEGFVAHSPAARARLPRVSQESPTHGMTRQEAAQFLAASKHHPVQHALVCLLLVNGLRISEALGANIEDLGVEDGHRTVRIRRKGGKRQTIPLPAKTARAVDAAIAGRQSGPLLLNKFGDRLSYAAARAAVDRIGRRAALPYHAHAHLLRHCFVTIALEAGAPLHDVQDSVGHADPRTTRRYDRRRGQLDRNSSHLVSAFIAG